MAKTSNIYWNDGDVFYILLQHIELEIYFADSLQKTSPHTFKFPKKNTDYQRSKNSLLSQRDKPDWKQWHYQHKTPENTNVVRTKFDIYVSISIAVSIPLLVDY
jgi:hypothetical protein